MSPRDPRRRHRLRHQLDPAAGRGHRPADGTLADVDRRMEIVRLGQGVDRTGRLAAAALERTFAACRRYAEIIAATHSVERVRFVATSATRDAANRDEFVAGVRGELGVEPEVITGDEEAALSFARRDPGAASAAQLRRRRTSSSTSAAARPSSCSGEPTVHGCRGRSTSAVSG